MGRTAFAGRAAARLLAVAALVGCSALPRPAMTPEALRQQVWDTERAFARSMAERDFAAFARHLSEHAVFFDGRQPLRGKAAVVAAWQRFYDGAQAPFAWEPDRVELLGGDGALAYSTGPVRDPQGKTIARFHSVWRLEAPGVWRIVLDRGEAARD